MTVDKVGVNAISFYYPKNVVDQSELERVSIFHFLSFSLKILNASSHKLAKFLWKKGMVLKKCRFEAEIYKQLKIQIFSSMVLARASTQKASAKSECRFAPTTRTSIRSRWRQQNDFLKIIRYFYI